MKLELLKQLYDLVVKYSKNDWRYTTKKTILGHNVTVELEVDNIILDMRPYVYVSDISYLKASKPFFDELTDLLESHLEESPVAENIAQGISDDLREELKFYYNLGLRVSDREYINNTFFNDGKLQTWKNVVKNYVPGKQEEVVNIVLSSSYTATIRKNKPVEVGCQRIPIDTIRKIVEAYDNL